MTQHTVTDLGRIYVDNIDEQTNEKYIPHLHRAKFGSRSIVLGLDLLGATPKMKLVARSTIFSSSHKVTLIKAVVLLLLVKNTEALLKSTRHEKFMIPYY